MLASFPYYYFIYYYYFILLFFFCLIWHRYRVCFGSVFLPDLAVYFLPDLAGSSWLGVRCPLHHAVCLFWRRQLALCYVLFYWSTFVLLNVCYFVVFFTVFYSITGPSQFGFRLSLFLITCRFYAVVLSVLHDYDAASYFLLYYNFKCFAFSCLLLFYFLDVLQSGIWSEANSLADPSLRKLVPDLLRLQFESKAPSTVQKYRSGWIRWREWADSKFGVSVIPAKPLHIALFISELTAVSISNNTGISPIQSVVYSIKWGHSLAGIVECPTGHPLVKSSLEGARRKLARPVQPKEPLSVDTVLRIAEYYISSSSLAVIRFLFVLLVGFAGFFRMDEIRNLTVKDVSIFNEYMSVFIPKRKNDQYREGHTSFLARSHKATCPVSITERLLKLFPSTCESSSPLVRRIVKTKSRECFHASRGVSYSTLRDEFKKFVKPFVGDIALYGTHSIKCGAASNPACRSVSADLMLAGNVPLQRTNTLSTPLVIA